MKKYLVFILLLIISSLFYGQLVRQSYYPLQSRGMIIDSNGVVFPYYQIREHFHFIDTISNFPEDNKYFRFTSVGIPNADYNYTGRLRRIGGVLGEVVISPLSVNSLYEAVGLYGYVRNHGSDTLSNANALHAWVKQGSSSRSSKMLTGRGLESSVIVDSSNVVDNFQHIKLNRATLTDSSRITSVTGIYIDTMKAIYDNSKATAVTDGYAIYQAGANDKSVFYGLCYFYNPYTTISGSLLMASGSEVIYSTRGSFKPVADGELLFRNSASAGWTAFHLGGVTKDYPSIRVNGAGIDFKLANNGRYTSISANSINIINSAGTTVAKIDTNGTFSAADVNIAGNTYIPSASYIYLAGNATTAGSWRLTATTSGNCLIEYTADGNIWTAKQTLTP